MKTLLAVVLLFSSILYAQENIKKDRIISKMNNSHNCFITYLDEDYVMIKSDDGSNVKFFLDTVDNIEVDGLGVVYSEAKGFSLSLDSIRVYLVARNKRQPTPVLHQTESSTPSLEYSQPYNADKEWFFEIYYFPSITKGLHYIYQYPVYFSSSDYIYRQQVAFEIEQNIVTMESHLGYNINQNLFLTLSLGYSSDEYKNSSTTYSYSEYGNTQIITEFQNSIDKFIFEFGIKYYFGKYSAGNVNPFLTFSLGKQIAFVDNYSRSYQVGASNSYNRTDNESEFLEGLNSPLLVSVGFGAEYAITKSLSLSGFLAVKYSSASSTFEWKTTYEGDSHENGSQEVETKEIKYKTGIGLSFYF